MSLTIEAGRNTTEATQDELSLFPEGYLQTNADAITALLNERKAWAQLPPKIKTQLKNGDDPDIDISSNVAYTKWLGEKNRLKPYPLYPGQLERDLDAHITAIAAPYMQTPQQEQRATITTTDASGKEIQVATAFTHKELAAIKEAQKTHDNVTKTSTDEPTKKDTTGYTDFSRLYPSGLETLTIYDLTDRALTVKKLFRASLAAEWALHRNTPAAQNGFATQLNTLRSLPGKLTKHSEKT